MCLYRPVPRRSVRARAPLSSNTVPMTSHDPIQWHGTTILSVRKNGQVVIAGDGQVSVGQTVMK